MGKVAVKEDVLGTCKFTGVIAKLTKILIESF